ncbi:SH3-like domain-containing protein, partial [Atopobacter phocae]|uniref:SH3-like domain-containing protein n=1 Tax=Atopobacter phocae TaxID=136492 RepID=UPI000471EF4C
MKKTAQLFLSLSSIALSSMAINQTIFADDISTGVINEAMVDEEKAVDVTHSNSTDLTNLNDEKISKSTTDTSLEEEKAIVKTRETVFNKEIALDKNEVNELVKNKKVSLDAKEEKEPKISQNDVMYNEVYKAAVIFGQYSIDTRPWGEEGFQKIGDTSLYTNKIVDIIGENKDGYYKLVKMNEENLGWIDHRAFGRIDATTVARIGKGSYSVDTQPWGMEGYKKINETDHLLGKEVKVVSQKQNKEYSYVLV